MNADTFANASHDLREDFAVPVKLWLSRDEFKRIRRRADRLGMTVGQLITAHLPAEEPKRARYGTHGLNESHLAAIRHALGRGATPADVAAIWGVSAATIQRITKEQQGGKS